MAVVWFCRPHFRITFLCVSLLPTLKMEGAVYFELWAYVFQTTRHIILEDLLSSLGTTTTIVECFGLNKI